MRPVVARLQALMSSSAARSMWPVALAMGHVCSSSRAAGQ